MIEFKRALLFAFFFFGHTAIRADDDLQRIVNARQVFERAFDLFSVLRDVFHGVLVGHRQSECPFIRNIRFGRREPRVKRERIDLFHKTLLTDRVPNMISASFCHS